MFMSQVQGRSYIDAIIGGIYLYIHVHIHTVKTIAFKRNPSGRTQIYKYTPPPPPHNYWSSYGLDQVVCLYGTEAAQIPEFIVVLCQLPRRIHPRLLETFQAGQLKAPVFIAK
jgi:hypothetical protein